MMGRSVRISEEAARHIDVECAAGRTPEVWALALVKVAIARLDRTSKRKHGSRTPQFRKAQQERSRKPSKEEKRDETSAIRDACLKRAAGRCECGCGEQVWAESLFEGAKAELDHFFGRGKVKQSVETCWILRADCHREKTNGRPDAATWLRKFITHCQKHLTRNAGTDPVAYSAYRQAAISARNRLRFIETRAALPAAPRVR